MTMPNETSTTFSGRKSENWSKYMSPLTMEDRLYKQNAAEYLR